MVAQPDAPTDYDLIERWQRDHDEDAAEEMLTRYKGLLRSIARKYVTVAFELDDAIAQAYEGFSIALNRFDIHRDANVQFVAYMIPTVRGRVANELRDHGSLLKMQRPHDVNNLKDFKDPNTAKVLSLDAPVKQDSESTHADWALSQEDEELKASEAEIATRQILEACGGNERERNVLKWRIMEGLTQYEVAERLNTSQAAIYRMEKELWWRLRAMWVRE